MSIVIGVLTFILVLTSLFLVMIVLMQRAKTDGGIGAAMAGGATARPSRPPSSSSC